MRKGLTGIASVSFVLNDGMQWVTFHSGYDFGYLLKLLTCRSLVDTQSGFFDFINMYFPLVYDIKHLMKFCNSLLEADSFLSRSRTVKMPTGFLLMKLCSCFI
ncbi:hypothetical protein CJ030_MR7G014310 [Morella rubra]|uniref:Uncharacterized protein n=1 Tax=Morella rubra TaxID=262757 RepID=A0A6A1V0H6_9ROSI|nr:hypothetical protein CJ030_MR7G014310 [Morella rubra]